MFELTHLRNGAVLNRHNGKETEKGLEIRVEGCASIASEITVNGIPAFRDGAFFQAPVLLTQKINPIIIKEKSLRGIQTLEIQVVWDKQSFPRYNFYVDDTIFFLTDLAKERPASLTDHFYPAFLQRMHKKYGTKFTLNIFSRNMHHPFELKDMPDCYKSQWEDCSDWLKLAFHADGEFPQYDYAHAAQKLLDDYDRLREEVIRFAGEKTFIPTEAIHWCTFPASAYRPMRERGVKILSGWFVDCPELFGEKQPMRFSELCYNLDLDTCLYLEKHSVIYNPEFDLFFNRHNLCINRTPADQIAQRIDRICSNPIYNETVELQTHEQYSFPYYFNYIPDHEERIENALRRMTELGYKPVFFHDGLLGNPAWE